MAPIKGMIVFLLVFLLNPLPIRADGKAFYFVIAYSFHKKTAYYSAVMEHEVKSKSMNDQEYVADMKLIRAIEDAFQKFLKDQKKINIAGMTFSAHTGYKSAAIAAGKLENEKADLQYKGISATAVPDFRF